MSNANVNDFASVRVCVAGGFGNVGSAIVDSFRASGARLVVTTSPDRHSVPGQDGVMYIPCDATNGASVERLFGRIKEAWDGVDIVVNTVGGYGKGSIRDTSPSEWDRIFNLNLRSAFLLTQGALRCMDGNSWGRIIHIAAKSALRPTPGSIAYGLSKSGVVHLVETAALECMGTGITLNAIAPGIIDTPQNREGMPDSDFGRWVSCGEIAGVVMSLSQRSSDHITGTTIQMPEVE